MNKVWFSICFPSEKMSTILDINESKLFPQSIFVTKINWVRISTELKIGFKSLEQKYQTYRQNVQ